MSQIVGLAWRLMQSSIFLFFLILNLQNLYNSNLSSKRYFYYLFFFKISVFQQNLGADSQPQPSVVVYRSINSKDGIRTYVSQNGNIDQPLSDLDDLFFEIESPEDIRYTYRIRIAKSFGSSFV